MKQLFKTAVVALGILASQALANVTGYWTTIDDKTGKAKSVVQIYEYKGKYYGRIVDLLENKNARAATPGKPLILGMDIIWDLEKDGAKKSRPTIFFALQVGSTFARMGPSEP